MNKYVIHNSSSVYKYLQSNDSLHHKIKSKQKTELKNLNTQKIGKLFIRFHSSYHFNTTTHPSSSHTESKKKCSWKMKSEKWLKFIHL